MRALLPTSVLLLWIGGCTPKVGPTPLPPPPPVRIPPGCAVDQSGTYLHAEDPTFRYRAADDGGTLAVTVERLGLDGGTSEPTAQIVLERTSRGFVGRTHARVFTGGGRSCPAEFPTEVVACGDGGLLLRSAPSAAVDEACHMPSQPVPSAAQDHRLLRQGTASPAGDAGPPDAG